MSLLSRADDEYGFNSAGRSRSPPPRHYESRSYDDRTREYPPPVRSYDDRGRSDAMPSRNVFKIRSFRTYVGFRANVKRIENSYLDSVSSKTAISATRL